jgi:hypothetical protein
LYAEVQKLVEEEDTPKILIIHCGANSIGLISIRKLRNYMKYTISQIVELLSCLVSLYLIHAPLFFLVTKVEMQLLILTLWLSAELFEIMLRQVKGLYTPSLHQRPAFTNNFS